MNGNLQSEVTVGVVDHDRTYFDAVAASVPGVQATFRHYASGREALRRGRQDGNQFWLIRVSLPDMTGFDLVEMLRDRLDSSTVCLVATDYRVDDELQAYRTGVAMYACRPVETAWLRQSLCRVRNKTPVAQAGPSPFSHERAPPNKREHARSL
ncbi:MAG: response regulator [Pirellulales bacterium]|nr:response regulator [Pirellulales bacterium]